MDENTIFGQYQNCCPAMLCLFLFILLLHAVVRERELYLVLSANGIRRVVTFSLQLQAMPKMVIDYVWGKREQHLPSTVPVTLLPRGCINTCDHTMQSKSYPPPQKKKIA